MNHLHLLVPDLFPPQDIATEVCVDLQLTALEKILARSTPHAPGRTTLTDWLCESFAADGVAPVRAAVDGMATGGAYWLCADPVHLQMQHAQVMLWPDVAPSQEEATALCANLNEHFAGEGLKFHAPHPKRWYVEMGVPPQMVTVPLPQAAWLDAKLHQPHGVDAMRWQRIVTEAQMLLHAHPVNQVRHARGELPVNSLWLWGGGRATELRRPFDAVGGDSELAGAFADAAGVPQLGTLSAMLDAESEAGLWVCSAPGDALRRGDLHAWRVEVQRLEQEFAEPVLKALQAGRVQKLVLEVPQAEGGQRFDLTRGGAWRFWRTRQSVARYAV